MAILQLGRAVGHRSKVMQFAQPTSLRTELIFGPPPNIAVDVSRRTSNEMRKWARLPFMEV